MNPNPISPDDPRLTLYALGEMEPREQSEFEKLLEQDAAARQAVAEIRATVETVTAALEQESSLVETSAAADAMSGKPAGGPVAKVLRFPRAYFMISGLAAACFAVCFVLWQNERQPKPQIHLLEMAAIPAKDSAEGKVSAAAETIADNVVATDSAPPAVTLVRAGAPAALPEAAASPDAFAAAEARAKSAAVVSAEADAKKENEWRAARMAKARMAAPVEPARVDDVVQLAPYSVVAGSASGSPVGTSLWGSRMLTGAGDHLADHHTEAYAYRKDNGYLRVADEPLSTFSIDVDTASYANVRRFLTQGQRPPADAVRIEELVNYFPYAYQPPAGGVPFAAHLEVAGAPWAPGHRLVRIGLKGREVSDAQRPAANLVFLIDVSGSMNRPNKLPLVKQSLRLLVGKLRPDDRVAIAVYAGASGLALPSTGAARQTEILQAIDRLEAGGSTNGAMGIHLAYDIAKANFIPGGVNRVILATDGDFNVGTTSEGELVRLIGEKAGSGVFLSVLGFGMGNLKDGTLEQLADQGNGNYAYIDTLAEARKVLVEQAGGTLVTIAQDVKIQVEFNPAQVSAYRLIGYENRLLAKEDFNNDAVDAGEIGAGHTVTALYEVVPAGAELPAGSPAVDALKYQVPQQGAGSKEQGALKGEMLTVKIRYKEPAGDVSSKLEFTLRDTGARFEEASQDFKFAAAVAGFGMVLRASPDMGSLTLASVAEWGRAGTGSDAGGYRAEFLRLVQQAEALGP